MIFDFCGFSSTAVNNVHKLQLLPAALREAQSAGI